MNSISRILFILFISGAVIPAYAQEEKYKQALDSLLHYMNYRSDQHTVKLLTFYNPGMQNGMSERFDSLSYLGMTDNNKVKIVIAVGSSLYMLNLALIDTSFVSSNSRFIRVKDLNKSRCLYHSAESRIFNGKFGGVPIDEIQIPMITYLNGNRVDSPEKSLYSKKIDYFLKQAILYSKKVKIKKKDLIIREN